jgi:hypothetical protein
MNISLENTPSLHVNHLFFTASKEDTEVFEISLVKIFNIIYYEPILPLHWQVTWNDKTKYSSKLATAIGVVFLKNKKNGNFDVIIEPAKQKFIKNKSFAFIEKKMKEIKLINETTKSAVFIEVKYTNLMEMQRLQRYADQHFKK